MSWLRSDSISRSQECCRSIKMHIYFIFRVMEQLLREKKKFFPHDSSGARELPHTNICMLLSHDKPNNERERESESEIENS